MSKYRTDLPQLGDRPFLTDGGLETTLIFHDGIELPHFAAFDLLRDADGREALRSAITGPISRPPRRMASASSWTAPTWRASPDWGGKLGYSPSALAAANRDAIALMLRVARRVRDRRSAPMVVSGCDRPAR